MNKKKNVTATETELILSNFFFVNTEETPSRGTGGSVVEFSPATREARVRFPASARSRKFLSKTLSFSLSLFVVVVVVFFFFFQFALTQLIYLLIYFQGTANKTCLF